MSLFFMRFQRDDVAGGLGLPARGSPSPPQATDLFDPRAWVDRQLAGCVRRGTVFLDIYGLTGRRRQGAVVAGAGGEKRDVGYPDLCNTILISFFKRLLRF